MRSCVFFCVAVFSLSCAGPSVAPARDRSVEHTPERVERGRYLANHVVVCVDCHSTRDWSRFSGPLVAGSEGKGGMVFSKALGFPGDIVTPNITPFALSSWTDGELDRAITVGVTKQNRALFPIMPYPHFKNLCQDDVDAIVAYVRTLPSIEHTPSSTTSLSFPMSMIVNSIPKDSERPACVNPGADEVARGKYLADVGACVECHSQSKRGQIVEGGEFAGGRAFKLEGGTVVSANLTPGGPLGGYTKEAFAARFRAHGGKLDEAAVVDKGGMQTLMSWTMYAGMTDADLHALFAYLQTLPKKETPLGPDGNPTAPWTATTPE